jgi:hypothetical protein
MIYTDQGNDHEGMENELVNFYTDLLTKPYPDRSIAIGKSEFFFFFFFVVILTV